MNCRYYTLVGLLCQFATLVLYTLRVQYFFADFPLLGAIESAFEGSFS